MNRILIPLLMLCVGFASTVKAENTDLSAYDNVIYVAPTSVEAGSNATLSICMKNIAPIRGFQFNLYLPEGITAVKNSKGRIQASLSEGRRDEGDEHTLSISEQDDGSLLFLCGSQYDETFIGTEGEIGTLSISVSTDMAPGEYPILLKAMKLTETVISKFYEIEQVETTITITATQDNRIVLNEASTTVPASATKVNVLVKRTIKADEWSTICLPFAMTEAQCKTAFGEDVQLGDFEGTEPEFDAAENVVGIAVSFGTSTAIEANHPYIIKVSNPITEFTVDGVDINADEDESYIEFDNGKSGSRRIVYSGFYGTYHAGTVLDQYTLFLNDNKFWYSAGKTKMKAFRAYFDFLDILTDVEDNYASRNITMSFNNNTTGISIMHNSECIMHNSIYDLQGRRVVKPGKGLYIKNGRKEVVR